MKKKVTIMAGVGAAFVAGALLSPIGLADAGHTNVVLTAELRGREEVDPTGAMRRVADRKGPSGNCLSR